VRTLWGQVEEVGVPDTVFKKVDYQLSSLSSTTSWSNYSDHGPIVATFED
jgi:hypothetical protein